MKLTKAYVNIILIILTSCLYVYFTFVSTSYLESELGQTEGFFSTLFVTLNHALYADENNMNFRINSADWLYEFKDGWNDYFLPYEVKHHTQIFHLVKRYPIILTDYAIAEYKLILPRVYRFNEKTSAFIDSARADLDLISVQYDAISIRGDKRGGVDKYVDLLIAKSPEVKIVYVDTDRYAVVEEIREYISKTQLTVEVKSLCAESDGLINVAQMDPYEVYDQTVKLIAGVDLVCKSNLCVCDYEDAVGRFVKLFHNDSARVYNVADPDNDIDYKRLECPAFTF